MEKQYDALIIGGGAAGLTAGIIVARARAKVLLIDDGQPRNAPAEAMHGFLSRDGLPPQELVAIGAEEFEHYGGEICNTRVEIVTKQSTGLFDVQLADGTVVTTKTVLLATGLTDKLPDIPGIEAAWGSTVHHCPHCHGYEVLDHNIVVIASDVPFMSMHQVALLKRQSATIMVCTNGIDLSESDHDRLNTAGIEVITTPITALSPGNDLGITFSDGSELHCDCAFIAPQPIPNDSLGLALGCDRDPHTGFLSVDHTGMTTIPGVWAAGNVVNPRAQIITAASEGSVAGIAMAGFIAETDF